MKIIKAMVLLAILIFGSSVRNVFGCSFADGALFPSNYDRVKEAEAIVLVDAVSLNTNTQAEGAPVVYLQPVLTTIAVETIKGNFAGGAVSVSPVTSCFGYDYRSALGQQVLLLLNKDKEGNWAAFDSPLGWINKKESGSGGPWEAVVREYARIDQINDYEQEKAALRTLQKAARMDRRNFPAGLDKDIEEHLNAPYPTKSYKDLFEIYSKGAESKRRDVLWALAKGKHTEARPLMQSLMRSSRIETYAGPVSAYVNATQDYSSIGDLGRAYLKIKGKHKRWPILEPLTDLALDTDTDLMIQALKSSDVEEAGRLSSWFIRHPADEATAIIRKIVGMQFGEPEKSELARSLAALGDKAAVDYARETVASTKGSMGEVSFPLNQSPGWKRGIALMILGSSPLAEAEAVSRGVIAEGNLKDIVSISDALLNSASPNRWQRLRGIPNLKVADEVSGHSIKRQLETLAMNGDRDAILLLGQLK